MKGIVELERTDSETHLTGSGMSSRFTTTGIDTRIWGYFDTLGRSVIETWAYVNNQWVSNIPSISDISNKTLMEMGKVI